MIEIIVSLVTLFVELLIHLVAAMLSASWVAAHTKGLRRLIAVTVIVFGSYLIFALLRGFVPSLNTPALAGLFGWPFIAVALVGLLIALAMPTVLDVVQTAPVPSAGDAKVKHAPDVPFVLVYLLAIGIVFGALAMYSSAYRAPKLTERLCATWQDRASPTLRQRLSEGLASARDITGRDLAIPSYCAQN
jgi:hypothetical protein